MARAEHFTNVDLRPRLVERVDASVDRGEVLRYLGYPVSKVPGAKLQIALDDWIDEAAALAEPRATYVVLPVAEIDRHWIRVHTREGVATFKGAIGEFLGPVQLLVAFIATAGPAVERLASQRMAAGDDLAAMVANAVGAERAEAAEAAVVTEVAEQFRTRDFATTLPYSPGYCGMALTQQSTLFELFGGERVGVRLTEDYLMQPLKSISGLIGLGPASEITAHGSPCDRCELYNCEMRR